MKQNMILLTGFFLVLAVSISISFLGPEEMVIVWNYFDTGEYAQYGITIHETSDKGYLLGGTTYTESNSSDIVITKLNAQREMDWQRYYGGADFDYLEDLKLTSDGGFIALSDSSSADAGNCEPIGLRDIWIIKADIHGEVQWEQKYGGTNKDYSTAIIQTSDGGFLITGYTASDDHHFQGNHGKEDCFVMKLNTHGEVEWSRLYGGFDNEEADACIEVEDGYIIAADTNSVDADVSKQSNNRSIWLFKLDKQGKITWNETMQRRYWQGVEAMAAAPDGGFLVAGFTEAFGYNNVDCFLVKINHAGYREWEKTFGGDKQDLSCALTTTKDGHYLFAGISGSQDELLEKNLGSWDVWIIEMDTRGEFKRKKHIGGSDYDHVLFIGTTQNDDILIAGQTDSKDGDFEDIKGKKCSGFYFQLNR